ncbi:MAG: flagellar export protein FliJ [Phycisphaeraceae bacterium]|nr:flagellar export protein FliJ [Phycisphaeraceae bacterium]
MTRFRFRLDPLLARRAREERVVQGEVASLIAQAQTLEQAIRTCQERIRSGKSAQRDGLVGAVDLGTLRDEAAGAVRAMSDAQKLVLELAAVHRRMESARGRLTECARKRRSLELIRDQRFQAFRREEARRETSDLDEAASRIRSVVAGDDAP